MKCPYCGHELREGDKYCSNCAAPVSLSNNAQSSLEPDSNLHTQGSLESKNQNSLENENLNSEPGQTNPTPPHQKQKPAPLALIACVLLCAVAILLFVSTFTNWQRGRRLEQALSQNTSAQSGSGTAASDTNNSGSGAAASGTNNSGSSTAAAQEDSAAEESAPEEETAASQEEPHNTSNHDVTYIDAPSITYSDASYIKEKGYITIGITSYPPFAYLDENGHPEEGFDIELIRAVFDVLGFDPDSVEFVEINWDNKLFILNENTIDCIWNALPITEENKAAMEMSIPYAKLTEDGETLDLGVGFRKGSDFCEFINIALKQCEADGTLDWLAEKYGVER